MNGKRIEEARTRSGSWNMNYYNAPSEGVELILEIRPSESLKIRVVDQSHGLPEIPGGTLGSRPADIIPAPVMFSDSTVVSKSFSY